MARRRCLVALVVLAAVLHLVGIARAVLPAQDGLKFLRVARQFQTHPWADVVRGADQHPLYPAAVALAEPVVAVFAGHGPNTWRMAAQGVAMLAALGLIVPLYGLTRQLFNDQIALLAVLIYVILPLPSSVGHDTLSDSLALLATLAALRIGEIALRTNSWGAWVASGLVAGLGYLARPEVIVVPAAIVLASASTWRITVFTRPGFAGAAATAVAFLAMVGSYAFVKGEVSEKLALRSGASLGSRPVIVRKAGQWLPPGLDDPRWDFSPKEESEEPGRTSVPAVVKSLTLQWAEALCGVFAFFAAWGVARDRFIQRLCHPEDHEAEVSKSASLGRRLIAVYLALFSLVLVRHVLRMGYLSDRHTLTLVIASIPWAAAGAFVCARGIAVKLRWSDGRAKRMRVVAVAGLVLAGIVLQAKPAHPSRWGHWAAGMWLTANTEPGDAVLDTRGWAAFVSQRPSYDYWHVRQAFTDANLAYVVVGTNELKANSRRAETLRAVLAYAAEPVVEFPERRDGHGSAGVRVYRYHQPTSWEGLNP